MLKEKDYDYFEPESVPQPKEHVETPEEREERELREATIERSTDRARIVIYCAVTVIAVMAAVGAWLMWWHPYEEGDLRAVVMNVTTSNGMIKTYEAQLISEALISDTTHVYQTDFACSLQGDSVASLANRLKGTGRRVTVHWKRYHATLPWRGNSCTVATAMQPDTVPLWQ